ncbi:hypothetical protein AHAS_Ahas09G0062100 [Arachis hypogaea]
MVKTSLRSKESKGDMKSGRRKRLDEEGNCRLVCVMAKELHLFLDQHPYSYE